ncbi:MAG: LCP family protein [bacterium]
MGRIDLARGNRRTSVRGIRARTNCGARRIRIALLSISISILIGLGAVLFLKLLARSRLVTAIAQNRPINILIIGTDSGGETSRSDVVMLLSYVPQFNRVVVTSIPRDTMVDIPEIGRIKLNHLYAYGYKRGGVGAGAGALLRAIEGILGVEIPLYVRVDYQGFVSIVDLMGGVRVDVDGDMRYVDRAGGLYINIPKGVQNLDGKRAMQYVRYRGDLGDLGRINRQHKFVQALIRKLRHPSTLAKLPKIADILWRSVDTNLTLGDVSFSLSLVNRLDGLSLRFQSLPGSPTYIDGISYWRPDIPRARNALLRLLREADEKRGDRIRVEVLNGCGVNGAAAALARRLSAFKNLDVVRVGNADRFDYSETIVQDKVGRVQIADEVARTLGIGEDNVFSDVDVNYLVDVVVIVGGDYKRFSSD